MTNKEPQFDANGWCDDMSIAPINSRILVIRKNLNITGAFYCSRRCCWVSDTSHLLHKNKPTHWKRIKPPVEKEGE